MIGAIWAHAGGVIGCNGQLPWHLPEDLAHFKSVTTGATVVMGRHTWESLPQRFRPLPRRDNIVASRDPQFYAPGAQVISDITTLLSDPRWATEPLWIIGGGKLYQTAVNYLDIAEITEIDEVVSGDTFAPDLPAGATEFGPWRQSSSGLRFRFGCWRPAPLPGLTSSANAS